MSRFAWAMLWGLFIAWVITLLAGCTGANSVNVLPSRLEVSYGMGDMGTDFTTTNPISASSEAEWVGLTLGWDLFVPTVRVLPEANYKPSPIIITPDSRPFPAVVDGNAGILELIEKHWVASSLIGAFIILAGLGPVIAKHFTKKE